MRHRELFVVLATVFLMAGSTACSISTESILEMQEGSALDLTIGIFPPQNMPLEGGTVMNIDVSIGLLDLLFGKIGGDVNVGDVLFATPPFNFLGFPAFNTEEVCITSVAGDPGGGDFVANIYAETATFDVALNTIALIGAENLAALLPDGGLTFPFALQAEIPMTLGDMLGMLTGIGSGSALAVEQDVDLDLELVVFGNTLQAKVAGNVALASADAFPSTPLLEDCIAFLAE